MDIFASTPDFRNTRQVFPTAETTSSVPPEVRTRRPKSGSESVMSGTRWGVWGYKSS